MSMLTMLMLADKKQESQELHVVRLDHGGLVMEMENRLRTAHGKVIHSFLGIPYGEAKRFQKPVEAKPWQKVFKARNYVDCVQVIGCKKVLNESS